MKPLSKFRRFAAASIFLALLANTGYMAHVVLFSDKAYTVPPPRDASAPPLADALSDTDASSSQDPASAGSAGSDAAPSPHPLTWQIYDSAADPGFCVAWRGFGSGMRSFESAQAVAFSGPMRARHWVAGERSSEPSWEIRMAPSSQPFSERVAFLRKIGHPLLQVNSRGEAVVASAASEAEAQSLIAKLETRGAHGLIAVRIASPSVREKSIIFLPQSANDIDFIRSLPKRIRGSSLAPSICPTAENPSAG